MQRDILEDYNLSNNGRVNTRTLKNPNGTLEVEQNYPLSDYRSAGFVILALVLGVVAITVTYITTFLISK